MQNKSGVAAFKRKVWKEYRANGRHDLPWRIKITVYRILVSEIMLQQTQVSRVIPKFNEFLKTFPNVSSLAAASLADVLRAWQGLGYNRRAKYLHTTAQIVVREMKGKFPKTVDDLRKLPGIGVNTAGAIMAYAYDQPVMFIETNIRRSFIHEFFANKKLVSDVDLIPLITVCVKNEKSPKEWYWALMDYGSMLGRDTKLVNPNRQSKHYTVQSTFEGSRRQIRGKIVKYLVASIQPQTHLQITKAINLPAIDIDSVLEDLVTEGLVGKKAKKFSIR